MLSRRQSRSWRSHIRTRSLHITYTDWRISKSNRLLRGRIKWPAVYRTYCTLNKCFCPICNDLRNDRYSSGLASANRNSNTSEFWIPESARNKRCARWLYVNKFLELVYMADADPSERWNYLGVKSELLGHCLSNARYDCKQHLHRTLWMHSSAKATALIPN